MFHPCHQRRSFPVAWFSVWWMAQSLRASQMRSRISRAEAPPSSAFLLTSGASALARIRNRLFSVTAGERQGDIVVFAIGLSAEAPMSCYHAFANPRKQASFISPSRSSSLQIA